MSEKLPMAPVGEPEDLDGHLRKIEALEKKNALEKKRMAAE